MTLHVHRVTGDDGKTSFLVPINEMEMEVPKLEEMYLVDRFVSEVLWDEVVEEIDTRPPIGDSLPDGIVQRFARLYGESEDLIRTLPLPVVLVTPSVKQRVAFRGLTNPCGVELQLNDQAIDTGIPMGSLDCIDEAIDAIVKHAMPLDETLAKMEEFEFGAESPSVSDIVRASELITRGYEAMDFRTCCEDPFFDKEPDPPIGKRVGVWYDLLVESINEARCLVVLGAINVYPGLVPGEVGVITRLRRDGFRVERVV